MKLSELRLSRRQAIGAAAGTVLAGAALAYGLEEISSTPAAGTVSADGWPSPLGSARGMAAHLLRRAGFAYTEAELDAAAAMSYEAAA